MRDLKIFTIAALAAAAIALMVGATVTGWWMLAGWAVLAGMATATLTAWLLIEASIRREGTKLEALVAAVVAAVRQDDKGADVHQLH